MFLLASKGVDTVDTLFNVQNGQQDWMMMR
jgi:hypothetical protein